MGWLPACHWLELSLEVNCTHPKQLCVAGVCKHSPRQNADRFLTAALINQLACPLDLSCGVAAAVAHVKPPAQRVGCNGRVWPCALHFSQVQPHTHTTFTSNACNHSFFLPNLPKACGQHAPCTADWAAHDMSPGQATSAITAPAEAAPPVYHAKKLELGEKPSTVMPYQSNGRQDSSCW